MTKWILGTLTGILGAILISINIEEYSKYGFLFFLSSSITFTYYSYIEKDKQLLLVQIAFIITNIIGIVRWF
jgi:hypothetical protein